MRRVVVKPGNSGDQFNGLSPRAAEWQVLVAEQVSEETKPKQPVVQKGEEKGLRKSRRPEAR